jgi:hypothetical protein
MGIGHWALVINSFPSLPSTDAINRVSPNPPHPPHLPMPHTPCPMPHSQIQL